ncbi:transcriptional regulator [Haloferax sp. S1W]|uniref:transcriptional regulator n=1 Tax=Haloferax sp. S1W TaxID=3377110 RepID=UPI0037CC1130
MAPDRDKDTGRYRKEYPVESFLQAVSELEVATTSKVAKKVGCSYDLAYRRLHELEERGNLKKQEVGGSFVWQEI